MAALLNETGGHVLAGTVPTRTVMNRHHGTTAWRTYGRVDGGFARVSVQGSARPHSRTVPALREEVIQTWEYDAIYIDPNDLHHQQLGVPLAIRALNRMGQQGWEAVSMVDMGSGRKAVLFKRPVEQASATTLGAD